MIVFRPMDAESYQAYLDYFVPDYAAEISVNYRLSEEAALVQARSEIVSNLPDGAQTEGHVLQSIMQQNSTAEQLIGYLWYKPDLSTRSAFIYDFCVLERYRGQGLARQVLSAFEDGMRGLGFEQLKLRVAASNDRARHVYEATGFQVTGINMSKVICAD
ncbi:MULTISPECIES: GNAT family N-acetyltransferase [Brucella/Ochrobactrum group]|uniref:GNAT family N-acetyltransferase n=1 Tax=Brucella/Ochrobactrum group TaxID=2826938 RepID=UPI00207B9458|nr:GNAT family N-acetyltransferase [Brucella sp. NBRC 12950]GLU28304.1 N-acetyltransferase [Brucella sp. NBRC 12950]